MAIQTRRKYDRVNSNGTIHSDKSSHSFSDGPRSRKTPRRKSGSNTLLRIIYCFCVAHVIRHMFLFYKYTDDYIEVIDLPMGSDGRILEVHTDEHLELTAPISNSTVTAPHNLNARRLDRRKRTRPQMRTEEQIAILDNPEKTDLYANDKVVAKYSAMTFSVTEHVTGNDFCGHFNADDRIMISGITSHALATELALTLAEVCGVRHMVGFVEHLMNAEESLRLEFLYRQIPSLKVGLLTGSLDHHATREFFQRFQPTHVFVFQADVDEERAFALGLNLNNLRQICDAIIKTKSEENANGPALLYVATGASRSMKQNIIMESTHIILGAYRVKYGLDARALRLPQIFGPYQTGASWLHSDEFVRTVTEMYEEPSSTPALPLSKMGEPIMSVSNAIQSILASTKSGDVANYEWIPSFSAPQHETTLLNLSKSLLSFFRASLTSNFNEESQDSSILPILSWNHKRAKPYRDPTPSQTSPIVENRQLTALSLNYTRHRLAKDKSIENGAFSLLERRQHDLFPCISVCASRVECKPSIWDSVAEITKRVTKDCKSVVYTANFAQRLTLLPPVRETYTYNNQKWPKNKMCQVAFVSSTSTIFQQAAGSDSELNGRVSMNNWILVAVDAVTETMERSDLMLPKTNPESLFGKNVQHAVYIETRHYRFVPPLQICYEIIDRMKVAAEVQDDYLLPRRDTVFFIHLYIKKDDNQLDQMEPDYISEAAKFIRKQNNDKVLSGDEPMEKFYSTRQNEAYTRSLLWEKEAIEFELVDTSFMVYSLHDFRSRQLRCEWYEEELFWSNENNENLEGLSFAYVLHRWRRREMLHQTGKIMLTHDGEQIPLAEAESRKSVASIAEDGKEPSRTDIERELARLPPSYHFKIHEYITLRIEYP